MAARGLTSAAIGWFMLGSACRAPAEKGAGMEALAARDESMAPLPIRERGGAQLWGDNCARCHNSRSPSEFNDDQWDVITHHMRVRANLTAYEHETILRFLKSAN
jgi:hypothetical protein